MKKIFFITALLAVSMAVSACHTVIPIDESSAAQSDETSSAVSVESTVNMSEEPSSEENSRDAESSEAPSVPSYESSETFSEPSSEETSEEPSEEPSETSEEQSTPDESSQADDTPVLGSLFAPYYRIMKSGKYMLKTVESKIVGGEAMPYTTTIYRDGDKAYITIEESYGATSELLIRDGSTYWLDAMSKQAIRSDGTESLDAERVLFTEGIRYLRKDIITRFDSEYECEVYTDSRGQEFTFGFSSGGVIQLYRFYDKEKKDTITIDIDVSANITAGIFEIPDDYSIS